MRDAISSYFSLTLLFFFILLVSGFIALSVNYTKAYRIKNNVLTNIEKYEGNINNEQMLDKTYSYAKAIGYTASDDAINSAENKGYTCPIYRGNNVGWCYIKNSTVNGSFTVNVVVFINLNVPVIHQVFSNNEFFWMTGRTNTIPVL